MINASFEGGVAHLTPNADLVASVASQVRVEMSASLTGAVAAVRLDLSEVRQVDSVGISLVIGLYKSCQSKGISFSVEGVASNLMRVFKLFRLPDFFPVKEA